ncbi:unnamed protein product [Sphenostylis stenocarpa]|uniref:Uncharacterized protein n=1 Tax=Sphenostylis stenocarpa TaxID=92480 RepID=A0AA86SZY0_9FABA|nr:unnamed protein product [Sphenostylis stenocarpa]
MNSSPTCTSGQQEKQIHQQKNASNLITICPKKRVPTGSLHDLDEILLLGDPLDINLNVSE